MDEEVVLELVARERAVQPRLGTRKLLVCLQPELERAEVSIGRDRLFELLRVRGQLVERLRPEYPATTDSHHYLPVFTNRVKGLELTGSHQAWANDITFVRTREGFIYLSVITDMVSRKIVGYHCADTLEASGCRAALEMALAQLPPGAKPIHHSDRGCQYCSHEYVGRLLECGLTVSMTERDHCAENALAERMNGILKGEYGLGRRLPTKALARKLVDQAVRTYNERRPHLSLGYKTPSAVHSLAA